MSQEIRTMHGKVVLYKLYDEWTYCSSGYINPDPIEIGKSVWVGSLSSRAGYETTAVVSMGNTETIQDSIIFETKSGSQYLVVPLEYDLAAVKKHVGENAKFR